MGTSATPSTGGSSAGSGSGIGTAIGAAATGKTGSTASDVGTGASVGSSFGVIGTVVGAVVGFVASVVGPNNSASKPGQAGANMKSVPTDAGTALALATKWYTIYFTPYAPGGTLANASTQASGIAYWQGQIQADGGAKAWANFSSSPQPVSLGVAALATALQATYGLPYQLGPATANVGQSALAPASAPTLPVVAVSATPGLSANPAAQSPTAPIVAAPAAASTLTPELELAGAILAVKVL